MYILFIWIRSELILLNQKNGIAKVHRKYIIDTPTIKFQNCNDHSNLKG